VDLGDGGLTVREQVLRKPGGRGTRVLWSWYSVDAENTPSAWEAKLLGLRGVLRGNPEAQVIALGADAESAHVARERLQKFLAGASHPL
jgi:hypothetical protein